MHAPARQGVLLIGATGTFGSLLARQLAADPGIRLVLAGRRREALDRLAAGLGHVAADTLAVQPLDRATITAADLRSFGVNAVVDASGPFQDSHSAVIEAAIGAGCHYLDLADGRAFVMAIHRFDEAARRAGVAILSGASSTPSLSHAVLDALTRGWHSIDTVTVAISPTNRQPRGRSVVEAVTSYAGRPLRVFRDGRWTSAPGWGLTRRLHFPGIGRRLVSLCETPDLDLLVERFQPRVSAEMVAGLPLVVLHLGLAGLTWPVRRGWIESLRPWAPLLHVIANGFRPFGSDLGGMRVDVTGRAADGAPAHAAWSLVAKGDRGPHVPVLAVLVALRRLRDVPASWLSAHPFAGFLTLVEFEREFERLGIRTQTAPAAPAGASDR